MPTQVTFVTPVVGLPQHPGPTQRYTCYTCSWPSNHILCNNVYTLLGTCSVVGRPTTRCNTCNTCSWPSYHMWGNNYRCTHICSWPSHHILGPHNVTFVTSVVGLPTTSWAHVTCGGNPGPTTGVTLVTRCSWPSHHILGQLHNVTLVTPVVGFPTTLQVPTQRVHLLHL